MDFEDIKKIGWIEYFINHVNLIIFIFGYNISLIECVSKRYMYSKDFV